MSGSGTRGIRRHALDGVFQSTGKLSELPLHDDVDIEVDHFLSDGTCLEDVGS